MTIQTKRIYEPFKKSDGYRVLVDRLWPRGIKKEEAHIDIWMKDVAPTTELRNWFDHDPGKWTQFIRKYRKELTKSAAFEQLGSFLKEHNTITLLYGAKDEQYNQALALKKFLQG